MFLRPNKLEQLEFQMEKKYWDLETSKKILKRKIVIKTVVKGSSKEFVPQIELCLNSCQYPLINYLVF